MRKIVMFIGGIETQEYFTLQLAKAFKEMGHSVFLFQLQEEEKEFPILCNYIEPGNTVMVTFNYHGLDHEKSFYQNNRIFWETRNIPCYNIVLDHPFYYHQYLREVPPRYIHISIDRGHEHYMERFFPEITRGPFLPLAGTEIANKPFGQRSMDIVFTGNYTPPQNFDQYITRIDEEYTKFYYSIIDDLIAHPEMGMEEAFVKHLTQEMQGISDHDMKICMEKMIFIDLYVRFYFRGLVVKTLVDHGYQVHTFGNGWSLLDCKHPENLIQAGPQDSLSCLQAIADSKISLNVMPWFKEGAHDRVFNSMLGGAVSVSDDSSWMREHLEDGKDIVFYSLAKIDQLPMIVDQLLGNPKQMEEIAGNGYRKAKEYHNWACRAKVLSEVFQSAIIETIN